MSFNLTFGPYDFAGQCTELCENLRKYTPNQINQYKVSYNNEINLENFEKKLKNKNFKDLIINTNCISDFQLKITKNICDNKPDLVNLWHRPFIYQPSLNYFQFSGLDISIFRSNDIKVSSRFCGYEVRDPELEAKLNPYHPSKFGWKNPHNKFSRKLTDHMIENSDFCFVTDEEMKTYLPDNKTFIVPRMIDRDSLVDQFKIAQKKDTIKKKEYIKIVHAPTNLPIKGTKFIREAISKIKKKIKYVELTNKSKKDVMLELADADIAIGQMLIGWYGVFALEALAFGCPVICYIRPDLEHKFENTPIVPANIENLAEKINALIDQVLDDKEVIKKKSFDYLDKNHNPKLVVNNYMEILRNNLRNNNKNYNLTSMRDDWIKEKINPKNLTIKKIEKKIIKNNINPMKKILNYFK